MNRIQKDCDINYLQNVFETLNFYITFMYNNRKLLPLSKCNFWCRNLTALLLLTSCFLEVDISCSACRNNIFVV